MNILKINLIEFKNHLLDEEKATATVNKYIHDVSVFIKWLSNRSVDKQTIIEYKQLLRSTYEINTTNSIISSLNSFFVYNNWYNLKIKYIKMQKQIYLNKNRELSKAEYNRLLDAARQKGNERLYMIMQTICATGIRVSELRFITTESIANETAIITLKGKTRNVFIPHNLCKMLKKYAKSKKIKTGSIFVTKSGKPLDRSNICSDMKRLCKQANVSKNKVFPHNLRHLFARTYYNIKKDIVRLADILGHSSINTTRIYTMESGDIHRRQIQNLGLLRC